MKISSSQEQDCIAPTGVASHWVSARIDKIMSLKMLSIERKYTDSRLMRPIAAYWVRGYIPFGRSAIFDHIILGLEPLNPKVPNGLKYTVQTLG